MHRDGTRRRDRAGEPVRVGGRVGRGRSAGGCPDGGDDPEPVVVAPAGRPVPWPPVAQRVRGRLHVGRLVVDILLRRRRLIGLAAVAAAGGQDARSRRLLTSIGLTNSRVEKSSVPQWKVQRQSIYMQMDARSTFLLLASLSPVLPLFGCTGSQSSGLTTGGTGGQAGSPPGSGGAPGASGGTSGGTATGGTPGGTGTGGTLAGTGGAPGLPGTGGGGAGIGGTPAGTVGGRGGMSGDTTKPKWGLVEDPSADCKIPALPSVDSLTANPKLPDPFTKMDGTRITDKSAVAVPSRGAASGSLCVHLR